jgi:hypothetical protein
LKRLGLDPNQLAQMPRERADAIVGKRLAEESNYRTGYESTPHWANGPFGRFAWQFHKFAYRHTAFVDKMLKNAITKGDIIPLIRYLFIVGPFAGEGIADLRAWLRGEGVLNGQEDWNDKSTFKKVVAAMGNKRVPIESPFWRIAQNISTTGGLGIVQDYIQDAGEKRFPLSSLLGATPSTYLEGARQLWSAGHKVAAGEDDPLRKLGRFALRKIPVPMNQRIPNIVLPEPEKISVRGPSLFPRDVKDIREPRDQ